LPFIATENTEDKKEKEKEEEMLFWAFGLFHTQSTCLLAGGDSSSACVQPSGNKRRRTAKVSLSFLSFSVHFNRPSVSIGDETKLYRRYVISCSSGGGDGEVQVVE